MKIIRFVSSSGLKIDVCLVFFNQAIDVIAHNKLSTAAF